MFFFSQAQSIINSHIGHRKQERYEMPDRFDKKPTLGEKAVRSAPPPPSRATTVDTLASAKSRTQIRTADQQAAG